MERSRWFLAMTGVVLVGIIAGCATAPSQPASVVPDTGVAEARKDDRGWWSVQFRMARPPDDIRWENDLLIAHRIAAPILERFQPEIELWRFHRRSNDDSSGHQFSFLFYTSAAVAGRINQEVRDNPLLRQLLSSGDIRDVLTDSVDHNQRPNIGDTSDSKWSPVMQDNWPYFIMGVSRMWLGMIDQVSRGIGRPEDPGSDQVIDHYRKVNTEVTRIWQHESYHALLHHLNAVYGYEAMLYWEKRWQRF